MPAYVSGHRSWPRLSHTGDDGVALNPAGAAVDLQTSWSQLMREIDLLSGNGVAHKWFFLHTLVKSPF